jgi:hypothetical protein
MCVCVGSAAMSFGVPPRTPELNRSPCNDPRSMTRGRLHLRQSDNVSKLAMPLPDARNSTDPIYSSSPTLARVSTLPSTTFNSSPRRYAARHAESSPVAQAVGKRHCSPVSSGNVTAHNDSPLRRAPSPASRRTSPVDGLANNGTPSATAMTAPAPKRTGTRVLRGPPEFVPAAWVAPSYARQKGMNGSRPNDAHDLMDPVRALASPARPGRRMSSPLRNVNPITGQ